ncbi:2-methylthioadenine synthetase, partial [Enterorhabdus sp. P55]|nr:2-methylthioadenine synthetase [Enterorhabdus sp. P55]
RRAAELRMLAAELRAADRARRAGAVELAVVESPGRATTESYHEIAVDPAHASGVLVEVAL